MVHLFLFWQKALQHLDMILATSQTQRRWGESHENNIVHAELEADTAVHTCSLGYLGG